MSELDPATREEMLLQGILNGDTTTNIEPADRKERLLKAILENGGGGGGSSTLVANIQCYKPADSPWMITCDKTNAEIRTALINKIPVIARAYGNPVVPGGVGTYPKCTCTMGEGALAEFEGVTTGVRGGKNKQYYVRFYQTSEDEWTFSATEQPFPAMVNIYYDDLVELRSQSKLVPGQQYRITDYATIINGTYDLTAMGAQGYVHYARAVDNNFFDIIVTADDESNLNENARACRRENSTYAPDAHPDAWELKYCLDNDTTRFAWADSTNGKGVIFYMKDEHNNSCGYDFKNIQFLRYALKLADATADYTPSDTGLVYDASTQPNRYGSPYQLFTALQSYMTTGTYVNPFVMTYKGQDANNYDFAVGYNILGTIQFPEADDTYLSTFGADWYYTFDYYKDGEHYDISSVGFEGINTKCLNNTLLPDFDALTSLLESGSQLRGLSATCFENNYVYDSEAHGGYCFDNFIDIHSPFNTFGCECIHNVFGNLCTALIFGSACSNNTFGNNCNSNTFGNSCNSNTFGNSCNSNTFGDNCNSNTFGNSCNSNTFGNGCYYNTFGNSCNSNTFGDNCNSNTFGNNCNSNTFGDSCYSNTFGNSCNSNTFGDNCNYNTFGNSCNSNTFGDNCNYNTFGDGCDSNTFGNNCNSNTFGDSCYSNTFGDSCYSNTFGDSCYSNTFGNSCNSNTFGDNCYYNTFGTLDNNNILVGDIRNLTADNGVNQITVPTAEANGNYLYELINYGPQTSYSSGNGCATLITKTGYNTSTAKSTTDSGQTWA